MKVLRIALLVSFVALVALLSSPPPSLARTQASVRPIVDSVRNQMSDRLRALLVRTDSARAAQRLCPMPVAVPDSQRLAKMPTVSDTTHQYSMPLAKPGCVNNLFRK